MRLSIALTLDNSRRHWAVQWAMKRTLVCKSSQMQEWRFSLRCDCWQWLAWRWCIQCISKKQFRPWIICIRQVVVLHLKAFIFTTELSFHWWNIAAIFGAEAISLHLFEREGVELNELSISMSSRFLLKCKTRRGFPQFLTTHRTDPRTGYNFSHDRRHT